MSVSPDSAVATPADQSPTLTASVGDGKSGAGTRRWPLRGAMIVAATLGVSMGIAIFTFDFAEGLSYLSDDPNACVNCHVMQEHFDGWLHGSHHAVATCNDCHVPHDSVIHKYYVKAEHGYRHSKGFTLNDFHEPIQITPGSRAVVVDNCMRCHASIAGDLGGHGLGSAAAYPRSGGTFADCLHCHARVGHGPTR